MARQVFTSWDARLRTLQERADQRQPIFNHHDDVQCCPPTLNIAHARNAVARHDRRGGLRMPTKPRIRHCLLNSRGPHETDPSFDNIVRWIEDRNA